MCGISGVFRPGGLANIDVDALAGMTASMRHRGPDAEGIWHDREAGIGLAHQRLSIVDLSSTGAQPMHSNSGRFVLTYNGEIYNFRELRTKLEEQGQANIWRGSSDTEILLSAIEAWGALEALRQCRGMFAFALWDRVKRRLTLARDPAGEKPLHVGILRGAIIFGSELKALRAHPEMPTEIDREAIALYLRYGYIPAPHTLLKAALKILPGELVEIDLDTTEVSRWNRKLHWDTIEEARNARLKRFTGTSEEAVEELDRRLQLAVQRQMVADVPLGAFLSGGVDSALVVALMRNANAGPVKTFTIGFDDMPSEVEDARSMAAHLGVEHHAEILTSKKARDLLLETPDVHDEPFADPSQIPTRLVAAFARRNVTVSLSGDGSDELFSGYGRHHSIAKRWAFGMQYQYLRMLTAYLERYAVVPITSLASGGASSNKFSSFSMRLSSRMAQASAEAAVGAYEAKVALLPDPVAFVPEAQLETDQIQAGIMAIGVKDGWSALDQIGVFDVLRYLPDNILVKVDRAAMSHSLETRTPFLDADVMRFAFALPDGIKSLGGKRKGIVKAVLARYAPPELWDRPKHGFGIPVALWLRGHFQELVQELLSREAFIKTNVIDPDAAGEILRDFNQGNKRSAQLVWALLILQLHLMRLVKS